MHRSAFEILPCRAVFNKTYELTPWEACHKESRRTVGCKVQSMLHVDPWPLRALLALYPDLA